jgi:Ser-tRNA(Ala) deacylase AlaX
MTRKIFWEDPYLTDLDTPITSVNGNEVTVEQTIFFAMSGGQESDRGTIAGKAVHKARKEGKEMIYTLENDHGLKTGDAVRITIDWDRRYKLMRLHFAAELVLELFYQKLESIQKIGAHIAEDKARIDFVWEENISCVLPDICQDALKLIESNMEITSAFSDEDAEKRYWKVNGFARVPCGGTHLKRTGEVGHITLKRKNIGRGKERVDIFLN